MKKKQKPFTEAEFESLVKVKQKIDKDEQVYISLDGPDGVVIQTTMATYESFYKPQGYRLIGKAVKLPSFEKMGGGVAVYA